MKKAPLTKKLKNALEIMDFNATERQIETLINYLFLLEKWNRTINLTSVRNLDEMLTVHLLDSLSINPFIHGDIIDIGTGGGLPGIPLAIINPEKNVTLLDSNAKKTAFLLQCVSELKLENITVTTARVENYKPEKLFDTVISRAFSSIEKFYELCQHLQSEGGQMLIMKSQGVEKELEALPRDFPQVKFIPIKVPGLDRERSIVTWL